MTTPLILHLVENAHGLKTLAAVFSETERHVVVALSVQAAYHLERQGIPFKISGDFYSEPDDERAGLANFDRVLSFVRYIDSRLRATLSLLGEPDLSLAETNYVDLKILFDSLSLAFFEIKTICEKLKPARIMFYGRTKSSADQGSVVFTNQDPLYNRVVVFYAQSRNIPHQTHPLEPSAPAVTDTASTQRASWFMNAVRQQFQRVRGTLSLAKSILLPVLFYHLRNSLRSKSSGPVVFIMNPGYDVHHVARAFIRRGLGRLYCIDPAQNKIYGLFPFFSIRSFFPQKEEILIEGRLARENPFVEAGNVLFKDPAFLKFFLFDEETLFPLIKDKLENLFRNMTNDFKYYRRYSKLFSAFPRARLLMPTTAAPHLEMALKAGHKHGFALHKYQHGSDGYFYFPLLEFQDLTFQGTLWVYGKGVEKALAKHYSRPTRVIPVGSAALDHLQNIQAKGGPVTIRSRPVVVYPLNLMAGNRVYFSHQAYRDQTYFGIQRRIVDVFKRFPGVQLLLKLHPNPAFPQSPISLYVEDQRISNCSLVRSNSFAGLVSQADLFLIDVPSTVLLQALTTRKQIMIYNGALRFEPEAKDLIQKRCFYTEEMNDFITNLESVLTRKQFGEVPAADDFLKSYGTHLNDGCSAQRAVQILREDRMTESAADSERRAAKEPVNEYN